MASATLAILCCGHTTQLGTVTGQSMTKVDLCCSGGGGCDDVGNE